MGTSDYCLFPVIGFTRLVNRRSLCTTLVNKLILFCDRYDFLYQCTKGSINTFIFVDILTTQAFSAILYWGRLCSSRHESCDVAVQL